MDSKLFANIWICDVCISNQPMKSLNQHFRRSDPTTSPASSDLPAATKGWHFFNGFHKDSHGYSHIGSRFELFPVFFFPSTMSFVRPVSPLGTADMSYYHPLIRPYCGRRAAGSLCQLCQQALSNLVLLSSFSDISFRSLSLSLSLPSVPDYNFNRSVRYPLVN